MSDQQERLKLLEIISQEIQHCHESLWEEEKHYSWWVYIIFAGLISLYLYFRLSGDAPLEPCQRAWLMGFGSAFGVFISIMGYHVVRRESEFFFKARRLRNQILRELKVKQSTIRKFDPVRGEANKPLIKLFCKAFGVLVRASFIRRKSTRRKSTKRNSKDGFGIRDGFQLTFIITAVLFVFLGVFSVVTLI